MGDMLNGIGRIPIFQAISNTYTLIVLGLIAFIIFVVLVLFPFVMWLIRSIIVPVMHVRLG